MCMCMCVCVVSHHISTSLLLEECAYQYRIVKSRFLPINVPAALSANATLIQHRNAVGWCEVPDIIQILIITVWVSITSECQSLIELETN